LAASPGRAEQIYLRLPAPSRAEVERLAKLVDLDHRRGDGAVYAYASPEGLERLRAAGIAFERLADPGINPEATMQSVEEVEAIGLDWASYPTYPAYVAALQGYAATYPALARLVVIGNSTNTSRPHQQLALEITSHPDAAEDEPEVFLTSTMHGDETVGYVMLLHLVDELLTHYDPASLDPYTQAITHLVDSVEIWINPLANPDGTYKSSDTSVSGAIRDLTTTSGADSFVDPNRNFPDPQDGDHPDGEPYWLETQNMMAFGNAHHFTLSANFHGGAEVFNYPWDTWSDGPPDHHPHTDEAWYHGVGVHFASLATANAPASIGGSSYFLDPGFADGTTNGWDWYEVQGGRQDWMNWWRRCREVTIELSDTKNPAASKLPDYWTATRQSLLDYLATALTGIRGRVTDAYGTPLAATVQLQGTTAQESEVTTDPAAGDYHRMLEPGTYALRFTAAGFDPLDVAGIPVAAGDATRRDVVLLHPAETAPLFADNFEVGSLARWSATGTN
jgi:hypothetical protein